jgi:hypothetical protein
MSVRTLVALWFLLAIGNVLGVWLLDAGTAFLAWNVAAIILWGPTRRILRLGKWSRVVGAAFVAGILLLFVIMINQLIVSVPSRLPQGPVSTPWWMSVPPVVAALAVASVSRRAVRSPSHTDAPAA